MSKRGKAGQGTSKRVWWLVSIPLLGLAGIGIIAVYVQQIPSTTRWTVFGTAVAIVGAAGLIGGIAGFLFGIPHTVQGTAAPGGGTQYQGNTNLEQVSDWLTKIIVGVGLVQIGRLLPGLSRLGKNLKTPLGGLPSSSAFGLGLIISYAALGFLFLYLWARERFPRELQLATTIQQQLQARETTRVTALTLVNQQLSSLKSGSAPTQDQLDKAITDAPDSTRVQIFNQAEQVRRANRETDRAQMATTIPVFQALIAADTRDQYHRNHGCLGWALKDQDAPHNIDHQTWQRARDELSTAIRIRKRLNVTGWRLYEANRAVCNIHLAGYLDPQDPQLQALNDQIRSDLGEAEHDGYARPMVDPASATASPEIVQWLAAQL